MAQTERRIALAPARRLAENIVAELRPGCQRIEIAGSIRREKPTIGDLEIVAVPSPNLDLFGESAGGTKLGPILERLIAEGRFERIKGGDRYKQFLLPKSGCKLDLFLATPETFGCIFTIRTGSAEFSHRLVTSVVHGGLCPVGFAFEHGRLWRDGKACETPEEINVFETLGIPWIEPRERK